MQIFTHKKFYQNKNINALIQYSSSSYHLPLSLFYCRKFRSDWVNIESHVHFVQGRIQDQYKCYIIVFFHPFHSCPPPFLLSNSMPSLESFRPFPPMPSHSYPFSFPSLSSSLLCPNSARGSGWSVSNRNLSRHREATAYVCLNIAMAFMYIHILGLFIIMYKYWQSIKVKVLVLLVHGERLVYHSMANAQKQ